MKDKTDEELHEIVRIAENTHVPGSQYQRAKEELNIRNQQNLVEASKQTTFWYQKPFGQIIIGLIIAVTAGIILRILQ